MKGSIGLYAGIESRALFERPLDIMERIEGSCEMAIHGLNTLAPYADCLAKGGTFLFDAGVDLLQSSCGTIMEEVKNLGVFNSQCNLGDLAEAFIEFTEGWITLIGFELEITPFNSCPFEITKCAPKKDNSSFNTAGRFKSSVGECFLGFGNDVFTGLSPTDGGCDVIERPKNAGKWLGMKSSSNGAVLTKKNKEDGQCSTAANSKWWNFHRCSCSCDRNGQSCENYMMVDMKKAYYMSAFRYDDISWVAGGRVWKFKIESSQDGTTWIEVLTESDARVKTVNNNFVTVEWAPTSARYWRWYIQEGVCPTVASFDWRGEVKPLADWEDAMEDVTDHLLEVIEGLELGNLFGF